MRHTAGFQGLEGLVIVDTTVNLPGPLAGALLAELGARVIKVDPPQGDPVGRFPDLDEAVNHRKERLSIDLKSEAGRQELLSLLEKADGLLVGMRPKALQVLGLDYATVKTVNPRLIYGHVTGYPQDHPKAGCPGHDLNYLAESGLLVGLHSTMNQFSAQLADMTAALYTALIWTAALRFRDKNGRGIAFETNIFESPGILGLVAGTAPSLSGVLAGGVLSYHVYDSKDGQVALGALEPHFFDRFALAVEEREWVGQGLSPATEENPLFGQIKALFRTRSSRDWVDLGLKHDFPVSEVTSARYPTALRLPVRWIE